MSRRYCVDGNRIGYLYDLRCEVPRSSLVPAVMGSQIGEIDAASAVVMEEMYRVEWPGGAQIALS
jgi:hypothetical protein